ncbi:MAG TPA: hypothetical protein DCQ89_08580 [Psychrobacter sp.]|nr:hypothetical protein [Psychrobacter sp.]
MTNQLKLNHRLNKATDLCFKIPCLYFKAYSVADLAFFDYDKILQIYILTIMTQAYIIEVVSKAYR